MKRKHLKKRILQLNKRTVANLDWREMVRIVGKYAQPLPETVDTSCTADTCYATCTNGTRDSVEDNCDWSIRDSGITPI